MNVPQPLSSFLGEMAADFPAILAGNLVGIYLWGSLTYDAFDEKCSDVDCIVVTRRDLDGREFSAVDDWFKNKAQQNCWNSRLEVRFVIDQEFLDKTSRCCGYYPYTRELVRHASDGNPIIWMNIAQSGITLWGPDARTIAPQVSERCMHDALLLELNYLKEDLAANAGHRSRQAFVHNAYAVLTACRILYSAHHGKLVSKDRASDWAMEHVPAGWQPVIRTARRNRLMNDGSTTPQLEQDALSFVEFVTREVNRC